MIEGDEHWLKSQFNLFVAEIRRHSDLDNLIAEGHGFLHLTHAQAHICNAVLEHDLGVTGPSERSSLRLLQLSNLLSQCLTQGLQPFHSISSNEKLLDGNKSALPWQLLSTNFGLLL